LSFRPVDGVTVAVGCAFAPDEVADPADELADDAAELVVTAELVVAGGTGVRTTLEDLLLLQATRTRPASVAVARTRVEMMFQLTAMLLSHTFTQRMRRSTFSVKLR
jgi:hypothetical protein